jgi:predicted nuclease with RNAse H fold
MTGTRYLGLHLLQQLPLVDSPRPSVVAELDVAGRLVGLTECGPDAAVLQAVGVGPGVLAVDAPLAVPNATGRRDAESVLAWLDVPVFPTSRRRLGQLAGGVRGEALRPALEAAGLVVVEAVPDLTLREVAWEAAHPADDPPMDLAAYREAWLGVRAPRYRPKGAGRAHPEGLRAAHAILAAVVDLGGWVPRRDGDWGSIADAAVLDAVACAYTALRLGTSPERCLVLGTPDRGVVAAPADGNMRTRAAVHLERLRAEGSVGI